MGEERATVGLTAADIANRGSFSTVGGAGRSTLVGLVPDGAASMLVDGADVNGLPAIKRTAYVVTRSSPSRTCRLARNTLAGSP